jgi:hypothetical protein
MDFTQMLKDQLRERGTGGPAAKVYLKASDGTEFRGTLTTVGDDFVQIETENGRVYTVLVPHIVFIGLQPKG